MTCTHAMHAMHARGTPCMPCMHTGSYLDYAYSINFFSAVWHAAERKMHFENVYFEV